MRKAVLFFLSLFSFTIAESHSIELIETDLIRDTECSPEVASSAAHAVVTKTIVIDYSPFPNRANSVNNAIIRDGEIVDLDAEISKDPCRNTAESVTPDPQR